MKSNKMTDVAKDIIAIEFHNDKTIKKLVLEFYKICEKHNIKAHTKTKNGKIGHNYDDYGSLTRDFSREIAVAFGSFLGMKCTYINNSYYLYLGNHYTTEQLFDYWLKNIAYE